MTKILSDKYPLLLILHLARLSSSCDLVTCVRTHRTNVIDVSDEKYWFQINRNIGKINKQFSLGLRFASGAGNDNDFCYL